MDTRDKCTMAITNCLATVSSACRHKIMEAWEKNIFPYSPELERYLRKIYKDTEDRSRE